LGAKGVNIGQFVKEFNDQTGNRRGEVVPVVITVFKDKSFSLLFKEPPVPELIKTAAKIDKGSGEPGPMMQFARIKRQQVREIAERKLKELTAHDIDAAMRTVEGTARSMGIVVVG